MQNHTINIPETHAVDSTPTPKPDLSTSKQAGD